MNYPTQPDHHLKFSSRNSTLKALASLKGTEPFSSDLRDLTAVASGFDARFRPLTTKLLLAATEGESVENQEALAAAAVVVVVVVCSILDPLF